MTKFLQSPLNGYHFRTADAEDIDIIIKLVELAYRGDAAAQGWTTEAGFIEGQRTDRKEVEEIMARDDTAFILCFLDEVLVGSVQIEKRNRAGYLGMFAVSPEIQSKGIGSLLLAQAEQYVQSAWQCKKMRMLVITIRHELIDWYLRKGYSKTGVFKPFPYHEPRFGLPKTDDLKLEMLSKTL